MSPSFISLLHLSILDIHNQEKVQSFEALGSVSCICTFSTNSTELYSYIQIFFFFLQQQWQYFS